MSIESRKGISKNSSSNSRKICVPLTAHVKKVEEPTQPIRLISPNNEGMRTLESPTHSNRLRSRTSQSTKKLLTVCSKIKRNFWRLWRCMSRSSSSQRKTHKRWVVTGAGRRSLKTVSTTTRDTIEPLTVSNSRPKNSSLPESNRSQATRNNSGLSRSNNGCEVRAATKINSPLRSKRKLETTGRCTMWCVIPQVTTQSTSTRARTWHTSTISKRSRSQATFKDSSRVTRRKHQNQ